MALVGNASPENVQLALGTESLLVITLSKRDQFERRLGFSVALLGQRGLDRSHKPGFDGPSNTLSHHPSVARPG